MQELKVDILLISISSPLLVGVYQNKKLIQTIEFEGKTSDLLPDIFMKLKKQYNIETIFYVNGPGSFMAIKIAYIFLKTYCIANKIPLYAVDGFAFNQNSPIKALGKKYFFNNKDGKISVNNLKEGIEIYPFKLPEELDITIFSDENEPNYHLPAVN